MASARKDESSKEVKEREEKHKQQEIASLADVIAEMKLFKEDKDAQPIVSLLLEKLAPLPQLQEAKKQTR